MEEELLALIRSDTALSALVAGRSRWLLRPKSDGLPGLTLTVIDSPEDYHLSGSSGLIQSRVQIDVWAKSYTEAVAVKRALRTAIQTADKALTPVTEHINGLTILGEHPLTDTTQPDIIYHFAVDVSVDHY